SCNCYRRAIRFALLVACCLLTSGCWGAPVVGGPGPEPAAADSAAGGLSTAAGAPVVEAVVTSVVDGDTIELEIAGRPERVRLLGIDAPESVHPTVPIQCYGPEASAQLAAGLPPGSIVRIERDDDARDRYGRLLLYVYRTADGLFVNEWLVRNGLADTSFYEPNTTMAAPLNAARSRARAERVGLWGNCDGPDQPAE
ncbi:MAG: thermonuclease family protein, partial [Acidimicrobiales bacterium]